MTHNRLRKYQISYHQFIFLCLFLFIINQNVFAKSYQSRSIEKTFSAWTLAFNHKNLAKTCALFSPQIFANYKNIGSRNYSQICQQFKLIFKQKINRYHYDYKIRNIYHEKNLAAVRITWYLKKYKNNKLVFQQRDEGLDVLKNIKGQWKIVNYLAYPV